MSLSFNSPKVSFAIAALFVALGAFSLYKGEPYSGLRMIGNCLIAGYFVLGALYQKSGSSKLKLTAIGLGACGVCIWLAIAYLRTVV
jgi:hypothetical protein